MDGLNTKELRSSSETNALFLESHFDHIPPVVSQAAYSDFPLFPGMSQVWFDHHHNNYTSTVTDIDIDNDISTPQTLATLPPLQPWPSCDPFLQDDSQSFLRGTGTWYSAPTTGSWPDRTFTGITQNWPLAVDQQLTLPWNDYGEDSCPSPGADTTYSEASTSTSRDLGPQCDWPKCSKLRFSTALEYKLHTKAHARDVRNRWQHLEASNKCTWHGCTSQARLKTSKMLEDHISNIHINPLLCTRNGCKHRTPFRGKADLQRHIDTVHGKAPKIRCPYRRCQSSEAKLYSRKDKLISHLRDVHDTDPCPHNHCVSSMFSSPDSCESTAKHIGKMHGEYECALRSCSGTRSQFSEESFMAHLQLHHEIKWERVLKTKDLAKRAGRVLREEHVVGQFEFSDCTSCKPRQ